MIFRFILISTILCLSSYCYATFPQFDTFTPLQQHAIFEKLYKLIEGKGVETQTIQIGRDLWVINTPSLKVGSLRKHQDYLFSYNFEMGHEAGIICFKCDGTACTLTIEDDVYEFKILEVENLLI